MTRSEGLRMTISEGLRMTRGEALSESQQGEQKEKCKWLRLLETKDQEESRESLIGEATELMKNLRLNSGKGEMSFDI
jgi:hypothetical protein